MAQSIKEKFEAKLEERKQNPVPLYSRGGCKVGWDYYATKEEAEIHDQVFYHEALEQWDKMLKAKDKFSRLNPKAYMVLLD